LPTRHVSAPCLPDIAQQHMEAGTAALLRILWAAFCFYRIPTKGADCIEPAIACVVRISGSTPPVPVLCGVSSL
jgi:hypothetical protein